MIADFTQYEIDLAVESVVREVLWEAGVRRPPVDAFLVAKRLGCIVVNCGEQGTRASRVRLRMRDRRAQETILLPPQDRPERRQWSVAHELGEVHAPRIFGALGIRPHEAPLNARERLASSFGTRLLLPKRWLRPEALACDFNLHELKRCFGTASHELIAGRCLELADRPMAVTVADNGRQTWRRGSHWRPPPPCPAELAAWRNAHDRAEPCEFHPRRNGVARVRAWPVHEPGWRREILFTEFEESWE